MPKEWEMEIKRIMKEKGVSRKEAIKILEARKGKKKGKKNYMRGLAKMKKMKGGKK